MERNGTPGTKRYAESMPRIADDGFRTERPERQPLETLRTNPLSELIDDETYRLLEENGLLYEKGVRDFKMRVAYRLMRARRVGAATAIERLREAHPYLQYDTVRKIVYARNR